MVTWGKTHARLIASIAAAVVIAALALSVLWIGSNAPGATQAPSSSTVAAVSPSTPATATPSPTAPPTDSPTASPTPSPSPSASPSPSPSPTTTLPPTPSTVDDAGPIQNGYRRTGTWALSGDTLHVTLDNGETWTAAKLPASDVEYAFGTSMAVIDAGHIWATRSGPGTHVSGQTNDFASLVIQRTSDGGKTWQKATIPGNFAGGSTRLLFADPLHGVMLALAPATKLKWVAYRTGDGGATWKAGSSIAELNWNAASFGAANVWAWSPQLGGMGCTNPCQGPLLQVSRDAGISWSMVSFPGIGKYATMQIGMPQSPAFFDASHGLASVSRYKSDFTTATTQVFGTADGGRTWTAQGKPVAGSSYMSFVDATHWVGMVASDTLTVLRTDDAGRTWHQSRIQPEWNLMKSWFLDYTHGMALGFPTDGGTGPVLFRTDDAGETWTAASF